MKSQKNDAQDIASPSHASQDLSLRYYFLILLKRRFLILAVVILSVLGTTAFCLYQTPLYRSSSLIFIKKVTLNIVPQVMTDSQAGQKTETFLQNHYQLLQSKALASIVAEKLNLRPEDLHSAKKERNSSSQANTPEQQARIAQSLINMLTVTPIKNTTIFQIEFLTPDPKLSMALANTWTEEYVAYSASTQRDVEESVGKLVDNQVEQLKVDIQKTQAQMDEISHHKQVVNIDKDNPIDINTLTDLNNALTDAKQAKLSAKVHYEELQTSSYDEIPEVTNSQTISQLKAEYSIVEREHTEKSRLYQDDYPEMVRLTSKMEQIQNRISEEKKELHRKIVATARGDYEEAVRNEAALEKQMEESTRQTIEGRRQTATYEQLQVELEKKKKVLESLLTKQSETNVSSDFDQEAATFRIVQRAEASQKPSTPQTARNVSVSFLIGLAVGIFLSFILDFFDSSLKNSTDITDRLRLPLMGVVPNYEGNGMSPVVRFLPRIHGSNNGGFRRGDLVALDKPTSVASEALRTVRTSLLLSFPNSSPRMILVTSASAGEGKTFVASNLAVFLSQLKRRVVIIDGDMRNPRQHRVWNVTSKPGLGCYLSEKASYEDIVRPSRVERVSVIPSDGGTVRPSELLESDRFDELLAMLSKDFDHIVVDSPPILPVSDSVILANKCSNVVLVVRGGEVPRDLVEMAVDRVVQAEANLMGVVLNGIDLSDPYYYYSYYANKGYVYEKTGTEKESRRS